MGEFGGLFTFEPGAKGTWKHGKMETGKQENMCAEFFCATSHETWAGSLVLNGQGAIRHSDVAPSKINGDWARA